MDLHGEVVEHARARLVDRFGEVATSWWDELPARLAGVAGRYELALVEAIPRGNTSLVLRCQCADGRAAVLKLSPDPAIVAAEASALLAWGHSGRVPDVLASDEREGALLLEAIEPGLPLAADDGAASVDDVATLIAELHAGGRGDGLPGPGSLRDRVDFIFELWSRRVAGNPAVRAVVPAELVERSRELALSLANGGDPVLLHGDLHPGNVLDGGPQRGLVAIDPRPCVGDPAFDAVDWVVWGSADPETWRARAARLAEALGADAGRQWRWCQAFAAMMAAGRISRAGELTAEARALLELAPG